MSSRNKRKMSPPFVRMKRLNLADIDPDLLRKLSVPVTQNVEICKPVQKKTVIKEKHKKSEPSSCSVKRTKRFATSSTLLSPSKDKKLSSVISCSTFKDNKRKIVELSNSIENITFSDNTNLCNINSTSSLFCKVNEIFISNTKDKNIFEDEFKMKPITQISSCHCDITCVPAILDVSVVASAFKWHREKSNLPFGCVSAKGKLPHSDRLSLKVNKATLRNGTFQDAEEETPQKSNNETAFSGLDLGATTELNYSECHSVKEISEISSSSNLDTKNLSRIRICSQNFRKKKQCKKKTLSMKKYHKLKKQHKAGTLPTDKDEDFSNSVLDNFQNDSDLKICDIPSEYSEEVIQSLVDGSYQSDKEVNLSFVPNNEQDSFINNKKVKSDKQSYESVEKGSMIPKQADSVQPLNHFLNCNYSVPNLLTLNKENSNAFSIATVDEIGENVPILGKFSLCDVENMKNDSCEFEKVSSIKADEQSSNSRNIYETDILADVLDYEPSEASEIEISESESCNGEIESKQSQSDSNLPMMENSFEINDIQSERDNKFCDDSFTEQLRENILITLEEEPDKSTKLCRIMGNSCNEGSMEFIEKNDTFIKENNLCLTVNTNDNECKHLESNSDANFSFSEHVGTVENKTFLSSNIESDEINNNEMHKEKISISYLSENEQSDYQEQSHEYKDEELQKKSVDTEDDSESDSEPSFKRKCSNNNQGNNVVEEDSSVDELSQSKLDSLMMKLEEVLLSIQKKCKHGKLDDALYIANQYIPISDSSAQKRIFTVLFYDIMDSFRLLDPPVMEEVYLDKMKSTMEIFYDLNLYNTELCSAIIIECLSMKLTFPYGQQLFAFCEKNNVPINTGAVMSYINSINPSEMHLTKLISLLNFLLKHEVHLPKAFLKEILNLLFQNDSSSSLITKISSLLHYVDCSEINRDDLKRFVHLCIDKRQWVLIAHLICAWVKKTSFIAWLIETFASNLEDIGFCYEELAKTFYGLDISIPDQANFIFVQMGVCCLMEAYSKEHYVSAFKILLVFHQHKINYIDYQAPMYNVVSYIKSTPKPSKIFVFPFTVAFTALEICLHLERPKDAYTIFQNVSPNLPKEFDEALKLEIQNQGFHYLLKITKALEVKDPFVSGIKALGTLLSIVQTDFVLKKLNDYSQDIQAVYNKYMVSVLNAQKKDLIEDLYYYSVGPQKELFTLDSEVLRGLTVFFVKHNMSDEANHLFILGHLMNIYNFEKPAIKTPPWEMTVESNWISEEIKLIFLRFMKNLTPNLMVKNKTDNFDKWFSVKISIKNVPKVDYNVDCLNENSTIFDRICSVLKGLDSVIQWKHEKDGNSVDLIPETFYKFWFSKYSDSSSPSEIFKVTRIMPVSFGESCSQDSSDSECSKQLSDQELSKNVNCSVSETYHSDNTRLDESVCVNDSTCVNVENDLSIPQNNFKNNHNSYVQDNISKNSSYLSPQKIISICSTARQDISPYNFNNSEMSDHSSGVSTYVSPRKAIASNLSTSPKIKNIIHCRKTTPINVLTSTSPEKSLLISPNQIVSPIVQKKASPRNIVKMPNGMIVSNTSFENADQNHLLRKDLSVDNGKITAKEDTLTTLPEPNFKNVESKTGLKKNILTNKKHSAKCSRYKKHSSALVKSKSNISKLRDMKITLQNVSAQSKTLRIVKPVSGVGVITEPFETKIMNSQKPSFQCNIPEDVFLKIINFLKSKVMVKRKDLTPDQQQEKALSMGHSFIERNVVTTLDKKTMKLLNDYSDDCL